MKPKALPALARSRRFTALQKLSFAILASGALLASPSVRADTELDVNANATDLTSAASYTPATTPTTAYDVTFAAGTAYANPTAFTIGSNIAFGSLNDLNATAITISNTGGAAASVLTLGGTGDTGDSVTGSNAADLLFVATGANLTLTGGTGNAALGLNLAQAGNLDVAGTAAISSIISGTNGLTKTGAGTLTLSGANAYGGGTNVNAGTLQISSDANLGSTAAANQVTLNGGALAVTSDLTLDANHGLVIGAGGGTLSGTNRIFLNTANTLSGSGALTFAGTGGNILLASNAAQNFTGSIAITGGRVQLADSNVATATLGTGDITISNGGQLFVVNTVNNVANNLFLNGAGNDGLGAVRLNSSGTNYGGNLVLQSNATFHNSSTSNLATLNGNISGAFTFTFDNGTYILNGTSSASGLATTGGGVIQLGNVNAAQGSTVTVGGTNGLTFAAGLGSANVGALAGSGGFALADVASSPAAVNVSVGANNTSQTYSGVLSGAGSLTKVGSGTLTLTALSTYTGGTMVNGGILQLNRQDGTLNGVVTVNSGGTLNLSAADSLGYDPGSKVDTLNVIGGTVNATVNNNQAYRTNFFLTGGSVTSTGGGHYNFTTGYGITSNASATTSLFSGAIDVRDSSNLPISVAQGTTASGVDLNITGAITDSSNGGTGSITKSGAGTLQLAGTNTYSGTTTVSAGTLLVNGTTASTTSVSVASGSTLGGSGSLGGTATINGTLAPGAAASTIGTLTLTGTAGATISGTGIYLADLNATTSDNLALSGALTIASGATLTFNTLATPTAASYDLANYTSETGTFTVTNLPGGYTLNYGATELDLVAVPEPATWLGGAFCVGASGMFFRRRMSGARKDRQAA